MGLNFVLLRKLIRFCAFREKKGDLLTLGRQTLALPAKLRPAINNILSRNGFDFAVEDVLREDRFSDDFLEALGFASVVSMDVSGYEGADILHDLNRPVPVDLNERFDFILDGGTTEHVFDVATCMGNVACMLRRGGCFISAVPANNWVGHGFYQFGPELVYGYWKHGCAFDILACSLLPVDRGKPEIVVPDPSPTGGRPQLDGKLGDDRLLLYYEVRKGAAARSVRYAQQTDYVTTWKEREASNRGET